MKNRCPSEFNTKVIRINIGDYEALKLLAKHRGCTFAEALHRVITLGSFADLDIGVSIPRIQIPLYPSVALAVNGNKPGAIAIQTGGVRYV